MSTETATRDTTPATQLLTVELPELLGIAGTAHADALEALAAVLADAHVFDDLSPVNANRVAETVAFEVIRCDWALVDADDAVTDRAIAVQLDRGADCDDRMAVGLALHRATGVLEGPHKRPRAQSDVTGRLAGGGRFHRFADLRAWHGMAWQAWRSESTPNQGG